MTSYLFILQIKKMSQALCILPGSNKDRSKILNINYYRIRHINYATIREIAFLSIDKLSFHLHRTGITIRYFPYESDPLNKH